MDVRRDGRAWQGLAVHVDHDALNDAQFSFGRNGWGLTEARGRAQQKDNCRRNNSHTNLIS
jgi:hypothetical protein